MHQIAQICTYIFKNFPGVTPQIPQTGEWLSPLPRLLYIHERPPSHFLRASTADAWTAQCSPLQQYLLLLVPAFESSNYHLHSQGYMVFSSVCLCVCMSVLSVYQRDNSRTIRDIITIFSGHHPMTKRADKFKNGCIGVHGWRFNVSDVYHVLVPNSNYIVPFWVNQSQFFWSYPG